jgi:hypothetical protein
MTQAQISLALVHSHSTIMERNLLGAGGAKSSSARPKCTWTGPEPGAAHIHARQSLRASAVQRARRPTQHPAWPAEAPHHSSSFWGRGTTTPKSPRPQKYAAQVQSRAGFQHARRGRSWWSLALSSFAGLSPNLPPSWPCCMLLDQGNLAPGMPRTI